MNSIFPLLEQVKEDYFFIWMMLIMIRGQEAIMVSWHMLSHKWWYSGSRENNCTNCSLHWMSVPLLDLNKTPLRTLLSLHKRLHFPHHRLLQRIGSLPNFSLLHHCFFPSHTNQTKPSLPNLWIQLFLLLLFFVAMMQSMSSFLNL